MKSERNNANQSFEKLVNKIKQEVYSLEIENGKKPTFEEYVELLIDDGSISTYRLREDIRALALAWNGAELGDTNWKKIYNQLQKDSLDTNKNLTKKETQMNKSKILNFIQGLGLEIDNELVKAIRGVGVLKLLLGIAGFLLLRFLVSYFGAEGSLFTFYIYSAIALVLFLSWYMSELKEDTKILSVLRFGGSILVVAISLILILGLMYGIIQYLIQAFEYLYKLLF